MSIAAKWEELVEDMTEHPDVTAGKMFGCRGLRLGRKFFAVIWQDHLVLKLPPERGVEVIEDGGQPFEPMEGRVMRGWYVINDEVEWLELTNDSKTYLGSLAG